MSRHKTKLEYDPFSPRFYTEEWDRSGLYDASWVWGSKAKSETWKKISKLPMCPKCGAAIIKHFPSHLTIAIEKKGTNYYCNRCGFTYPTESVCEDFSIFVNDVMYNPPRIIMV